MRVINNINPEVERQRDRFKRLQEAGQLRGVTEREYLKLRAKVGNDLDAPIQHDDEDAAATRYLTRVRAEGRCKSLADAEIVKIWTDCNG